MKISDEMVMAALDRWFRNGWRTDHPMAAEWTVNMRTALTAALATKPDRYREGFEKAREMAELAAEDKAKWLRSLWMKERQAKMLNEASGADMAASAIRNMAMPDE
jgi:hypothetical protein